MSNFVSRDNMIEIFGEDLLDKKEMLTYFLELLGKKDTKPFECVGTIEEVTYVVNNLISNNDKLPYLLQYFKDNFEVIEPDSSLIADTSDEHNVNNMISELGHNTFKLSSICEYPLSNADCVTDALAQSLDPI
jgi:hypothetical protein